jgi:hypothetical protein
MIRDIDRKIPLLKEEILKVKKASKKDTYNIKKYSKNLVKK